ncbi:MAG TPA: inositol monophosphatase family protein [Spirochaetota bacterium]|nr:inositol monophosphatase family protein [Spirochaetota bacterium]HQH95486.1 inositol monophosphatase family protein [Spirochaetota bacterium]
MTALFTDNDFVFFKNALMEAGAMARRIQKETIAVNRKSDRSIVTQADLMVQDLLMQRISDRYDNVTFIMEENNSGSVPDIGDDTLSAIIDPIDGTAMFSMHLPEWCVSVGIFRGYTPVYGFVYSPGFDMLFYNDDGNAYMNERPLRAERKIIIDNETNIFCASEVSNRFFFDFPGKIRNLGSTALHACLAADNARNRTLAFIGKSNLWDWAGAVPIVLKAGCMVRYFGGEEIDYRAVIENKNRLLDYVVVYNVDDFDSIRNIFKPRPV